VAEPSLAINHVVTPKGIFYSGRGGQFAAKIKCLQTCNDTNIFNPVLVGGGDFLKFVQA